MKRKVDVDAILKNSLRRVDKEVTCPECGTKTVENVHPSVEFFLCDTCVRGAAGPVLKAANKRLKDSR